MSRARTPIALTGEAVSPQKHLLLPSRASKIQARILAQRRARAIGLFRLLFQAEVHELVRIAIGQHASELSEYLHADISPTKFKHEVSVQLSVSKLGRTGPEPYMNTRAEKEKDEPYFSNLNEIPCRFSLHHPSMSQILLRTIIFRTESSASNLMNLTLNA